MAAPKKALPPAGWCWGSRRERSPCRPEPKRGAALPPGDHAAPLSAPRSSPLPHRSFFNSCKRFMDGRQRPISLQIRCRRRGDHAARARRAGGARARGRGAGRAAVAGPVDHARAGLAHLLEEPGRLGPADGPGLAAARRPGRGRDRLAGAAKDPHRAPGQLRLRGHGAAAGAAAGGLGLPGAGRGRRQRGRAPARQLAGVQARMHSRRRRLQPAAAGARLHGAARSGLWRGPGGPAAGAGQRQHGARGRRTPADPRARPARRPCRGRRCSCSPKRLRCSNTRPNRAAAGRSSGRAASGPPACRCRPSAGRAWRSCRWCWRCRSRRRPQAARAPGARWRRWTAPGLPPHPAPACRPRWPRRWRPTAAPRPAAHPGLRRARPAPARCGRRCWAACSAG